MNNASVHNQLEEETQIDSSPLLRGRAQELTDTIEALQNIGGSSFWKVLKQYVFDVDLDKAKRRLALENDTTEMFRLQGEIRFGEKFNLEKLIEKNRNELQNIRKQLNGK